MVWVLIIVLTIVATVLGSVYLGHVLTMRAFSYNHPMIGNATDSTPGVGYYVQEQEDEEEEPDATLQAHQSLEALRKLGVSPSDTLGPDTYLNVEEEEDA